MNRVYLLVGKLKGPELIGKAYQDRAPALLESVEAREKILLKHSSKLAIKSLIMRQFIDGVVLIKDMVIEGAQMVRIPVIGHSVAVVWALLVYFPSQFKKNQ